jgi:hypothetical protein
MSGLSTKAISDRFKPIRDFTDYFDVFKQIQQNFQSLANIA